MGEVPKRLISLTLKSAGFALFEIRVSGGRDTKHIPSDSIQMTEQSKGNLKKVNISGPVPKQDTKLKQRTANSNRLMGTKQHWLPGWKACSYKVLWLFLLST